MMRYGRYHFFSLIILLLCSISTLAYSEQDKEHWRTTNTSPSYFILGNRFDKLLITTVSHLIRSGDDESVKAALALLKNSELPKNSRGIIISIYDDDAKLYRFIALGKDHWHRWSQVLYAMRDSHVLRGINPTHIQLDFVNTKAKSFPFLNASQTKLDLRFEIGVDGLLVRADNKKRKVFLPGDAYRLSMLTKADVIAHLGQSFSPNVMKTLKYSRLLSQSFLSDNGHWAPLYRGRPILNYPLTKTDLKTVVETSLSRVMKQMKSNGQFDYYYEPVNDSRIDHQHPHRDPEKNPYYNIIRHAAAIEMLLNAYEFNQDSKALQKAKKALRFLSQNVHHYHLPDGQLATYVYYNHKAKLGASGLALSTLSRYSRLSGDRTWDKLARQLMRHVVNCVHLSGEFQYYSIYLDKPVLQQENSQYFSMYYPGEALLGLTQYYDHLANVREKAHLDKIIERALDFLFDVRPTRYQSYIPKLPADSWLMTAAVKWWHITGDTKGELAWFVFTEADKMLQHLYTKENALYPDYMGSFYYDYGDHPYPDGARAEGLVAAYELALAKKDSKRIVKYYSAMQKINWALMHLYQSPLSSYFAPNRPETIASIRFKLTRQWSRIDTIQHVVAYYQHQQRLARQVN